MSLVSSLIRAAPAFRAGITIHRSAFGGRDRTRARDFRWPATTTMGFFVHGREGRQEPPRSAILHQVHTLPLAPEKTDRPREECGVAAAYTPGSDDAARSIYFMLHALQHRGQEAAGISGWVNERIKTVKDVGLVASVFHEWELDELACEKAIGHVRYSTTGDSNAINASPILGHGVRDIAVAHNGNLVNAGSVRRKLVRAGYEFQTTSDSEVIAAFIATRKTKKIREALVEAMQTLQGAYSLCCLVEGRLYCCRDANGIRPLTIGRLRNGGYVVASETCALDILGATYLRDVIPGELVEISDEGLKSWDVLEPKPSGCSLEAIYFARPDSRLGSETVYSTRVRLGQELAAEYPVEADMVVPVPNSGRAMAIGYAQASGIPLGDGLVKNEYVARTFIQPNNDARRRALRMKFNAMSQAVAGQRLVVVDDSLIRGNTMHLLVEMLREAGAAQVHVRIASPPTRWPCFYGIDMGRPGEYIATDARGRKRTAKQVAKDIGADSLNYLTPEGLSRSLQRPLGRRCTACFTGDYPIEVSEAAGKDLFENSGGRED